MERFEEKQERNTSPIGFLEVAYQLPESESLVLSRNRVYKMRDTTLTESVPVHYEALNYMADVLQIPHSGELVPPDEFHAVARNRIAALNTYPVLTVVSYSSDMQNPWKRESRFIDVAELIWSDQLPVYSTDPENGEHEILTLGVDTIIKQMAQKVGVGPIGTMVLNDNQRACTVEDTGLESQTLVHRVQKKKLFGAAPLNPRGPEVIDALQSDLLDAFAHSPYCTVNDGEGGAEVVIRVGNQPDLQTITLELIDLVESNGRQLLYTRKMNSAGTMNESLWLYDRRVDATTILAEEGSTDLAIYNAYLEAQRILNELTQGS